MDNLARSLGSHYLNTGTGTQNNITGSGTQYNAQTQNFYPKRIETPPKPSCIIPFRRDPDFVPHGTLLDQIDEKCSAPASRVALVGLGGVGKSQLAIEHCYRVRKASPDMWVFWVHASNAARFEQSYRKIANCIRAHKQPDHDTDIFQLVHDWLHDESKGKWVLVLDNVDDAEFLLEARYVGNGKQGSGVGAKHWQPLISYIPQCKHGTVLVTTRSKNAARSLVEEHDMVAVEPMKEKDALALLQRKLGQQDSDKEDTKDTAELVATLEYMPLAIIQAAAYILEHKPRCSVQQYLVEFQKGDRKQIRLLNHKGGQLRRDWEAKNSITVTWHISFNHIRHINPPAGDLLALMSFFDCQGIPETLLRQGTENQIAEQDEEEHEYDHNDWGKNKDGASISSADDMFENNIQTLRDYSFIFVNRDSATTFEMHKLVQLATRNWLKEQDKLEIWKEKYINSLCTVFPTGEPENWDQCQLLFPHAKSALIHSPKLKNTIQQWALLLYNAAWYAWQRGSPNDAYELSMKSMSARIECFGRDHTDTLSSMVISGLANSLIGKSKEAEELFREAMEKRVKVLGPDHPDTLMTTGNLASTYRNKGLEKMAEELELQTVETFQKILGLEHQHTLTSMGNLALTYRNQGRWKEAEEIEMLVTETSSRVLGEAHPHTLISIGNLASTLYKQGRLAEAEELLAQVISKCEMVLGLENIHTMTNKGNLAATYRGQRRWKEAEELELQVMGMRKELLGSEHPHTLTSLNNVALVFTGQKRWKEAEELFTQVIAIKRRVLGLDHPSTLSSMAYLALTYQDQGRWKEAEEVQVHVIEMRTRLLGERAFGYTYQHGQSGVYVETARACHRCHRAHEEMPRVTPSSFRC